MGRALGCSVLQAELRPIDAARDAHPGPYVAALVGSREGAVAVVDAHLELHLAVLRRRRADAVRAADHLAPRRRRHRVHGLAHRVGPVLGLAAAVVQVAWLGVVLALTPRA